MKRKRKKAILLVLITTIFLVSVWFRGGLDKVYLDSDIGRDLSEISKLWIGQKVIWLGPRFSVGLHSSPIYYYLFFIPVFLSGGSAHSLIIFNVILAASAIFLLGFLSIKKYGIKGILIPLVIGLMPWWQEIAIHPGNGFTYAIFLLAFLTAFWFKLPVVLSSFLLGISVSMHPGAVFGLPFLLYEVLKSKTFLKKWIFSFFAFLLPFVPLIAFEIVTKGYWLGQWMAQPSYGLTLNTVPRHYLFGLITIIWFTAPLILIQKKFGRVFLALLSMYFLINILITPKPVASERPISKIEGAVDHLVKSENITNNERLALVVLKSLDTKTPQADDYRFFLRVRGFKVEEVSDYHKAEKLVIFVEGKKLDWENWNSWETDEFGKRGEPEIVKYDDMTIVIYSK